MKIETAKKYLQSYYEIKTPTEDDDIQYIEALNYLIDNTKDSKYMVELGGFYYEKKKFDTYI